MIRPFDFDGILVEFRAPPVYRLADLRVSINRTLPAQTPSQRRFVRGRQRADHRGRVHPLG